MAIRDLDALRVIQDPTYAATLTVEEWQALAQNAEWMHLETEYADVVRYAVGDVRPTLDQMARHPTSAHSRPSSSTSGPASRAFRVWASSATQASIPRTSIVATSCS